MTDRPASQKLSDQSQRLDRWLWFARFFKTRTLAATVVSQGKVRVNGDRVSRTARAVKPGDVLTFPTGAHIRVIKITGIGTRRGPAPEAQALYEDQAPPETHSLPSAQTTATASAGTAQRLPGSGRPTKRERRQTAALKDNLS